MRTSEPQTKLNVPTPTSSSYTTLDLTEQVIKTIPGEFDPSRTGIG